MARERLFCVLSRVLGGKAFSGQLMQALAGIPEVEADYAFLEEEDYGRYRDKIPLFNRAAGLFVASAIMRWKLRQSPPPPFDTLLVQSFELLPGCSGIGAGGSAVLAHDSTNVASYRLLREQHPGVRSTLGFWAKRAVTTPWYRQALRRVRAFMPRTRWCADSLVADYGVDPARIVVAPGGVDTAAWSPPAVRRRRGLKTLLFVGNDFERKGGPFLVEVFRKHLYPRARLRLVSNDPSLPGKSWPAGVELLTGLGRDRAALVEVYRSADVFVLPTRKEHMGMVLTEAAAVGLPIVATRVGGTGEIVRSGENGYLLPRQASEETWAGSILDLLCDEEKRERFGRRSRELAEEEFSQRGLRERLRRALDIARG